MHKKTILAILTLFLICLTIPVTIAGSDEISITANPIFAHPQMNYTRMSSGKFVYVQGYDTVTNNIVVYVYGADGTVEATTSITTPTQKYTIDYAVIAVESNVIVIFAFCGLSNVGYMNCIEYNTDTYAYTITESPSFWGSAGGGSFTRYAFLEPILYNNVSYTYFTYWHTNLAQFHYLGVSYDHATNTLVEQDDTGATYSEGYAFRFQDDRDGYDDMYYIISGTVGDTTTPRFMKWDLTTAPATEPELLCDGGFANDYNGTDRLSMRWIGGGLDYNATAVKYFLYFTWAKSTTMNVEYYQNRQRYNTSGIDSTYLEAQDLVQTARTMNTGSPTEDVGVYSGLMETRDTFYVWSENKYAEPSDFRAYEVQCTISNWEDFALATMDTNATIAWNANIENSYNHQSVIYKHPTGSWEVEQKPDETKVKIWFDLGVDYYGYTLTWSYLPADSPLYTNTRYTFTGNVYSNDYPTDAYVEIWFDESLFLTRSVPVTGLFSFSLLTQTQGIHNLTIAVYDLDDYDLQTTGSTDYSFVYYSGEDYDTTPFSAVTINALMYMLPSFLIILVPAFALFSIAGQTGLLAGLVIGVSVGTVAGIVPPYVTLLMSLVIVLGFVYFIRRGNDGSFH